MRATASDLDTLLRLMPPPADGGTAVGWEPIAASWERRFPADYRRFMEVYGAGAAQRYLSIGEPEPRVAVSQARGDGMVMETANAQSDWDTEPKAPELEGTTPLLITWGVSATADLLCWDATSTDPSEWPVLVYNRAAGLWSRYDCGMAAFLTRLLQADFPECPLGGLFLWGCDDAVFKKESH